VATKGTLAEHMNQPEPYPIGAPDRAALERLRAVFLNGTGAERDYWQSEADLAAYDATFAQRIGWKWDHVLGELERRGWQPPPGPVLDWGCGSGVAARAWLDRWGRERVSEVWFCDRSPLAVRFAASRAREKYPGLAVAEGVPDAPGAVLLSHVLTELDAAATEAVLGVASRAVAVVWVEPGTYEASWRLIRLRERLRGGFHVVAPCTHGAGCGLLAPGLEAHWCHHFAAPPPAVFTDPFWGRFARWIGVDLRSLPVSYLVLDRRPPPPLPVGTVRVIGRPRVYKAHAAALACDAAGVAEVALHQRDLPAVFRAWRKGACPGWQVWEQAGGRVQRVVAWPGATVSDEEVGGAPA
jgi:SAM-dependent methyltransferase